MTAGAALGSTPEWEPLWAAIKGVWASKWGDRAWLSRRARRVPDSELFMACLIQQVCAAQQLCKLIGMQHVCMGQRVRQESLPHPAGGQQESHNVPWAIRWL